jgi:hypothetical protein
MDRRSIRAVIQHLPGKLASPQRCPVFLFTFPELLIECAGRGEIVCIQARLALDHDQRAIRALIEAAPIGRIQTGLSSFADCHGLPHVALMPGGQQGKPCTWVVGSACRADRRSADAERTAGENPVFLSDVPSGRRAADAERAAE